jgi:8-oxo-dGTP diphosphatase
VSIEQEGSVSAVPSRPRDHELLRIAADVVVLTVRDDLLQVLLVTRHNDPHAGDPALPGGFIRIDESVDAAARRELVEETGLAGPGAHLELLSVYSEPERDPRGRVVSVAYLALMPALPIPTAGTDARHAYWAPVESARGTLAFDHDRILDDAVERARMRLESTTLATAFCPAEFTMGDLRRVYEVVWGTSLDPRNFNRKVTRTAGFVEPTGRVRTPPTGRPAALYRSGPVRALVPPLVREVDEVEDDDDAR